MNARQGSRAALATDSRAAVRWLILTAFAGAYLLAFSHRLAVVPLFPELMSRYSASYAQAGSLLSWFYAGYALVHLPAGASADSRDPSLLVMLGLGVVGLTGLVFIFAPSLLLAAVLRFLMGAGVALVYSPALKIVSAAFPASQRGVALGVWEACAALATLLVLSGLPLLATVVSTRILQAALAVMVLLPLTAIAVLRRAGLAGSPRLNHPVRITAGISEALCSPVLRQGKIIRLMLVAALGLLTLNGATAWLPTFLRTAGGMSSSEAAANLALFPVAMMLGSPLAGFIADKVGRRRPVIVAGCVLLVVAFLALWRLPPTQVRWAVPCIGLGAALAIAPLLPFSVEMVGAGHAGSIMGMSGVAGQVGSAFSATLFGLVFDISRSFSSVWAVCALLMALRAWVLLSCPEHVTIAVEHKGES